ncbi:MAG TPA: zinc-dependent metalloprotease [Saprospiraceae bacterium]|nr:zinc-dependent metalloprotease [Saprospiraceae bacterium]HPI09033.1 zinc-dependent metalloprotease [Saprospiraceae bacterium]
MSCKQIILSLSLLFFLSSAYAQQLTGNWCGNAGVTPWMEWYKDHRNELSQTRSDEILYVPVTVHIIGTDQGTNLFPMDKAVQAICGMNERYTEAKIQFYLMPGDPFRFVNNSDWYEHQYPAGAQMINQNNIPDRLNAYVVGDPAGNCGYAWQDAIVLGSGCSGASNSTWSHEAGHHFSLPHPFSGWEGTDWDFSQPAPNTVGNNRQVERIDGTNCEDAGDFFCDTPPDYLHDRWQCDDNHESEQIQHDPNNVAFRSDATLIMGYASDACTSRFTPEQINAMRSNLETEHSGYLQVSEPGLMIDDEMAVQLVSPIDSHIVQYNNFELIWNALPNATIYVVEVFLYPNMGLTNRLFYKTLYNETSITVDQPMPNNRTLYWRVRAYNEWDVCNPNDNAQVGLLKTRNISATNELERSVTADLSPNPVAGGQPAMLSVSSDESMDAKLVVTDAAGRICRQQEVRIYPGDNRLDIETASLEAGIYIISLQNEKGMLLKRLAVTE